MSDLAAFLQQVAARYRRALLLKTSLLVGLLLGWLGVLGWRLHARGLSPVWGIGVPVILAVGVVGALVWWTRRRWISSHGTAAYLDRTFDLQQRLITAEEYSHRASPPALYSLLAQDVAQRCSTQQPRFPRPLDHTAGILLVALLLFLFWPQQAAIRQRLGHPSPANPGHGPGDMGHVPSPIAHVPKAEHPPSSSQASSPGAGPPSVSSVSSAAQDQRGTPSGAGQSAPGHQSSDGESPSDRGSQSQHSRSADASSSSSIGPSGSQPSSQTQMSARSSPDGQPSRDAGRDVRSADDVNQRGSAGTEREARTAPPASSGQHGRTGSSSASASAQASERQQQQASRSATAGQDAAAQRPPSKGRQDQGSAAASAQRAGAQAHASTAQEQQGAAPSQQPGAGSGSASFANQEAMKGEIQRLLKEVSGELKQLQVQLASAQERQPQPQAGTSADPNLYESPMPEDRSAGTKPVPFVLPTDTATTKTPRPSAGVGRPSGEVSRAGPQMGREQVSLSDQPAEEMAPSGRQPIPPEYRGVFDRLHHESPPGEQSP